MEGIITNKEPKVGEKMRIGDVLYGPVGTIQKIQKIKYMDNTCYAIPQMEEWPRGYLPDKEGCHLATSSYHEDNVYFLCWVKFDEHNIDKLLQSLYDLKDSKELMKALYGLANVGPNYQWWEELCQKLDVAKILIHPLYCLMVTMKPYRKHVSSFNDMVDRITAEMLKQELKLSSDTFSKWKLNYEPKTK